jgi:hypothetical protein
MTIRLPILLICALPAAPSAQQQTYAPYSVVLEHFELADPIFLQLRLIGRDSQGNPYLGDRPEHLARQERSAALQRLLEENQTVHACKAAADGTCELAVGTTIAFTDVATSSHGGIQIGIAITHKSKSGRIDGTIYVVDLASERGRWHVVDERLIYSFTAGEQAQRDFEGRRIGATARCFEGGLPIATDPPSRSCDQSGLS